MRYMALSGALTCACFIAPSAPALQPAAAGGPSDALVVRSAGLDAMLIDEKDQGLLRALRMVVDDRLSELVIELDADFPVPIVQFVFQLLSEPWTIQAGVREGFDPHAHDELPPIYAQWSFHAPDAASAETLAGRLGAMLAEHAPLPIQPVPERPGMNLLVGLDVPIYYGSAEIDGRHSLVIAVNHFANRAASTGPVGLPAGIDPVFAVTFDSQQIQPLLAPLLDNEQAGGDMAPLVAQLRAMGLLGEDAGVFSAAIGHSPQAGQPSHMAMRYSNYRRIMQAAGTMPDEGLSPADLRRVPEDATYVQLTKFNVSGLLNMLRQFGGDDAVEDMFDEVEGQTGIHPQRDVLDHLGQTFGVYMSDTTGSGGLLSIVGFVQVTDDDAMNATIARITGAANQMAQMFARGYIRFSDREINGQRITTLMFPGLPVPLELSFTIADGFLYAAASPQGLLGAIAQGRGDTPGLMDNPRFAAMVGDDLGDAIQVTFYDIPRALRSGYTLTSIAMAALANAARSPIDVDRDPGLIMPSLADLSRDARAAGYVARLDGDDLLVTGQFDRSVLVSAAGFIGTMGGAQALVVPALSAGVILPALGKAREQAQATRSMTNLRQSAMALWTYAAEHDDAVPPSMQALVEQGYLEDMALQSPYGPAIDGRGDYFFNLAQERLSDARYPDRQILGYDRAMFASQWRTAVVFYDGHVEILDWAEFEEIRNHRANSDVDLDLPDWW